MQLSQAILSALLFQIAVAAPSHSSSDERFTPESLAPHIAREIVDKSSVLQVSTIDKGNNVPISHIERHVSSDSCPDLLKFTKRNGNPILLLSKLNDTSINWDAHPDDVSITIEHPPFHGQDIFVRPSVNLFGTLQKLTELSDNDLLNLKHCFARLHRANDEWLNEIDHSGKDAEQALFFAEFDVENVKFVGDFGYGEFNGVIDGETYHSTIPPHEIPPCPWHLPPRDGEEASDDHRTPPHKKPSSSSSSKKHHGKGKKKDGNPCDHKQSPESMMMMHHSNGRDDKHEVPSMKHHGDRIDMDRESVDGKERNQKSHQDDDDDARDIIEIPNSQTIFEILKVWFNHY